MVISNTKMKGKKKSHPVQEKMLQQDQQRS